MKTIAKKKFSNQSGFIIADFLFAIILVVSCGIIIFGLTFSLASVEIAQYIVWSTARNYAAANESESKAKTQATKKFNNLADQFPLLTGRGSGSASPWLTLDSLVIGDLIKLDTDLSGKLGSGQRDNNFRQPWIGAKANIKLNLLMNFRIPFLGPVADPGSTNFSFPIRAFILRHPSQSECQSFYSTEKRFSEGIQKIPGEDFVKIYTIQGRSDGAPKYAPAEDNGC